MGEGQGCLFCNTYTHISYITQFASTFIFSKQQTDSTLNDPTCRCTQWWPNMCRFCTFKTGTSKKVHLKSTNACCPLLQPLKSNLKCWIYKKRRGELKTAGFQQQVLKKIINCVNAKTIKQKLKDYVTLENWQFAVVSCLWDRHNRCRVHSGW